MLLEDAGISTDLTITPGQTVSVSGDRSLAQPPLWGSGVTVEERGSLSMTYVTVASDLAVLGGASLMLLSALMSGAVSVTGGTASLSGCTLGASVSLTTSGGSLSIASGVMSASNLVSAQREVAAAGTLQLTGVRVAEAPALGELTATVTTGDDCRKTINPPFFGTPVTSTFTVTSGPCTVSDAGRCVGRPQGYLGSESCQISVLGNGGPLGPCPMFSTARHGQWNGRYDGLTLPWQGPAPSCGGRPDRCPEPGEAYFAGSHCPEGVILGPGATITWVTDNSDDSQNPGQGGSTDCCTDKGLCADLPSVRGNQNLGGGWKICFL